jgi:hypothetical protein
MFCSETKQNCEQISLKIFQKKKKIPENLSNFPVALKYWPSMAATAAKDQHEPQDPWLCIGLQYPLLHQFKLDGILIAWALKTPIEGISWVSSYDES